MLTLLFAGALSLGSQAQVVMKDFMSANHMGKVENS